MPNAVREQYRQAKEDLSTETENVLRNDLLGGRREMMVTRGEFQEAIEQYVALTIEALTRTINSAGLRPKNLASVLLVGGSSGIPLVAQTMSAVYGKPVRVGLHPKLAVATIARAAAQAPTCQNIPIFVTVPVGHGRNPNGE
ncbi:Hsp70 protein [Lentzea waywayandensis]|uniref:Hsp70 protein n=1 Tax=Lentzea waywayandensis TaxID=84724 RepID=A0A1I6FJH1_9PSEU|nr:Hsp70 family protein [Lentzea waywayandensis]SFR30080.1 Hsp70 protein [Lentzea waywayandensis]